MEYSRDDKHRDPLLTKYFQEVEPILILDDKDKFWIQPVYPSSGIKWGIQWHVEDPFGSLIGVSHFVSTRGIEGKDDPVIGIKFTETFNYRASLFKLSQGGAMKPYISFPITLVLFEGLVQFSEKSFPSLNPSLRFGIKQRSNPDSQSIEKNA